MQPIYGLSGHALWRGMRCKASSSFPRSRLPTGYETFDGALPRSTWCHTIDTASRPDAGSAGADSRTTRDPAARERLWGESFSGRLLTEVFEERLPLFAGQELVVA